MKRLVLLLFFLIMLVPAGCSPDRKDTAQAPPPPEQVEALSRLDRQRIAAFGKELFDIDRISAKALSLVGSEIGQVIAGEKESVDAASLLDAARKEAGKSVEAMIRKSVPEKLPPWFARNLGDAKQGFSEAYTARIASLDAIRTFMDEKNPAALLEYKRKSAQADRSFRDAREKLAAVLKACGLQEKGAVPKNSNPGGG